MSEDGTMRFAYRAYELRFSHLFATRLKYDTPQRLGKLAAARYNFVPMVVQNVCGLFADAHAAGIACTGRGKPLFTL
jgi:hypothetical protein